MTATRSLASRLTALETPDSFIVATQTEAQTVGATFEQTTGLVLGPQNFNIKKGPDLAINADADGIDIVRAGRYGLMVNFQFVSATGDGWFESAIEPNGLDLSSELWPGEIAVGHLGVYLPVAVFDYEGITPGAHAGYTSPSLFAGASVTTWAKFSSASGDETIDVKAVVNVTRITS